MKKNRTVGFWVLIIVGVALSIMYVVGQTVSFLNFDFTVAIGLQEPKEQIGAIGLAIGKGFAVGDTFIYIPFFVIGIIGLWKKKVCGMYSMVAAMAITVYWPIVNLVYVLMANKSVDFNIPQSTAIFYLILLPLISLYGLWGLWYLYTYRRELID